MNRSKSHTEFVKVDEIHYEMTTKMLGTTRKTLINLDSSTVPLRAEDLTLIVSQENANGWHQISYWHDKLSCLIAMTIDNEELPRSIEIRWVLEPGDLQLFKWIVITDESIDVITRWLRRLH